MAVAGIAKVLMQIWFPIIMIVGFGLLITIGREFQFHAHSEMGPLDGETQSHFIRDYVVELLSGYPVPAFGHSWSLGH